MIWNYTNLKVCTAQSLPSAIRSPSSVVHSSDLVLLPRDAVQCAAAVHAARQAQVMHQDCLPQLAAGLLPPCFAQSPTVKTSPSFVSEIGARNVYEKEGQSVCFPLPESRGIPTLCSQHCWAPLQSSWEALFLHSHQFLCCELEEGYFRWKCRVSTEQRLSDIFFVLPEMRVEQFGQ